MLFGFTIALIIFGMENLWTVGGRKVELQSSKPNKLKTEYLKVEEKKVDAMQELLAILQKQEYDPEQKVDYTIHVLKKHVQQ